MILIIYSTFFFLFKAQKGNFLSVNLSNFKYFFDSAEDATALFTFTLNFRPLVRINSDNEDAKG